MPRVRKANVMSHTSEMTIVYQRWVWVCVHHRFSLWDLCVHTLVSTTQPTNPIPNSGTACSAIDGQELAYAASNATNTFRARPSGLAVSVWAALRKFPILVEKRYVVKKRAVGAPTKSRPRAYRTYSTCPYTSAYEGTGVC